MTKKTEAKKDDLKKAAAEPRFRRKHVIGWGVTIVAVGTIVTASLVIYQTAYADKALPRTQIADTYIGGQTGDSIVVVVSEYADAISANGMTFSYGGREISIQPIVSATDDPDLTYELFSIDANATAQQALAVGHRLSFWTNIKDHVIALIATREVPVVYTFDSDAVYKVLKENFGDVDQPAANADLQYQDNVFSVTGENNGQIIDYQTAIQTMANQIQSLSLEPIELSLLVEKPTVTYAQAQGMIGSAQEVILRAPLTLRADEEISWETNQETLGRWLSVANEQGKITLSLKDELVTAFLDDKKTEYDIEMKEGKLVIENSKVTEFQPSQTGRTIIIEDSINTIINNVILGTDSLVALAVETMVPEQKTGDVNDLGIRELIGVGISDFSGSPTNRRKNIALGAAMLHGQLIPPGEEYSLVDGLNHFQPADGWLPELVIKGGKTVPEIGGGACQFGTTMFRATLSTGLPVTARRNHSYTVSYYNPIGTDATIYDPAPDYKFLNDTGHHVLIQTRIEGDKMYFELWGTDDGRVATQSKPVLSNWVAPPPTKITETTDLAPGVKKCTETAHSGVSASFNYSVKYADGTEKFDTFNSVYKPWQEVCLVGVTAESLAEEPEDSLE